MFKPYAIILSMGMILLVIGLIWFAKICFDTGKEAQEQGKRKMEKDMMKAQARAKRMANLRY